MTSIMKGTLTVLALCLAAGPARAEVVFETLTPGQGDSIDESGEALVQKSLKVARIWEDQNPDVQYLVNSNIVYMHRCKGSSCTVRRGSTNSSMSPDQSSIVCREGTSCGAAGGGTLSAFSRSEQVWSETLACVKEVFAPFNVVITDQDPGEMPHYEIMVGGTPTQLGFDVGTGGVSPATCGTIPSSLVFVFDVWGNNVNELCATAAQEIAHSWALDHVTDASDPMTYYAYANRRHFKDADVTCGSDCSGGYGPNGETCTGTTKQVRECSCNTGPTQNSVAMLRELFGDGTPTPPSVAITNPRDGQSVAAGFTIVAGVTDDMGISRVELYLDGRLTKTLTKAPWSFATPDDLTMGEHEIKVIAYDIVNTPTVAISRAIMTPPCAADSDCPAATDVCIASRCAPGPSVADGLGAACSEAVDCASGSCATTTEGAYCVEPCALGQNQCPDGFGCLDAGEDSGMGVCFPGYDESGGCNAAGGSGAPVTLGLAFASLLFGRRRRRSY
jgi:uncharacterized protein (TIGR03382 family)